MSAPPPSSAPASASASASAAGTPARAPRSAVRFAFSASEYEALHRVLISRIPGLKNKAPKPVKRDEHTAKDDGDEYHAASFRIALRMFLSTFSALRLYEFVLARAAARSGAAPATTPKIPFWRNPYLRLSASLSVILFLHRTLHRFFHRLRSTLLSSSSKPFRQRNPRTTLLLTSKLTPSFGAASIATSALALAPADQTRTSIAIYVASRALEFWYNGLSPSGVIKRNQPEWLGSWLTMPFACGQLLHAFVFDRDCFPAGYGNFITKRSPEYIQPRPDHYPEHLPWPGTNEVVDGLAQISKMGWPSFASPILFPSAAPGKTLHPSLEPIAPITDPANPAIPRLACALLHPHDPSCGKTFLQFVLRAFPMMARFFATVYGAFALLRFKAFLASPVKFLNGFGLRVMTTSLVLTGSIGTAWASICAMQRVLPGRVLSTERWFIGGFIAGLWGWFERKGGPGNFGYSARMSVDSTFKVGKKRGWWKGIKGGDVMVFMAGMTLLAVVYERTPEAVDSAAFRKALGVARGEGWTDRAAVVEKDKSKDKLVDEAVEKSTKTE